MRASIAMVLVATLAGAAGADESVGGQGGETAARCSGADLDLDAIAGSGACRAWSGSEPAAPAKDAVVERLVAEPAAVAPGGVTTLHYEMTNRSGKPLPIAVFAQHPVLSVVDSAGRPAPFEVDARPPPERCRRVHVSVPSYRVTIAPGGRARAALSWRASGMRKEVIGCGVDFVLAPTAPLAAGSWTVAMTPPFVAPRGAPAPSTVVQVGAAAPAPCATAELDLDRVDYQGCKDRGGAEPIPPGALTVEISAEPAAVAPGGEVLLRYTLTNRGARPLRLSLSRPESDFTVTDQSGKKLLPSGAPPPLNPNCAHDDQYVPVAAYQLLPGGRAHGTARWPARRRVWQKQPRGCDGADATIPAGNLPRGRYRVSFESPIVNDPSHVPALARTIEVQ